MASSLATSSQGGKKVSKRKEAPPVNNYIKGSKKAALDVAKSDEKMMAAFADYTADWKSSGDTSHFNVKTWSDLHLAWFDGIRRECQPVVPLTPLKIHIVGTLLKVGTYRSSKNYIDSIKTVHIEHGYKWKPDLDLAYKRYKASTQRGMGPPRQSDPLNLEAVLLLDLPTSPIVKNGPINSKAVACLYSFFVLREVEGSLAKRSHVRVNDKSCKVSWRLPVSKCGPAALGCAREWGCTRMSEDERETHCPFHTMIEHLKLIDSLFADWDPDLLPLFPQPDGEEVPPQAIVALIEELARLTGEAVLTVDGRNRFGKHSFRATGAVFLSTVGIEVAKIMMLGRWSCAVVLHYTRLAPLKSLASDFKRAITDKSSSKPTKRGQSTPLARDTFPQKKVMQLLGDQAKAFDEEMTKLKGLLKKLTEDCKPKEYVQNKLTLKTHLIVASFQDVGSEAITSCGWRYAHADVRFQGEPPTTKESTCSTCLPELAAALKGSWNC